jgi:hypothetical protein
MPKIGGRSLIDQKPGFWHSPSAIVNRTLDLPIYFAFIQVMVHFPPTTWRKIAAELLAVVLVGYLKDLVVEFIMKRRSSN